MVVVSSRIYFYSLDHTRPDRPFTFRIHLSLMTAWLLRMSYIFWRNSSKTFLKDRITLSSGSTWSFFFMAAVVPFSSSLAAYLWRYVHTMPVPTGYRMLATKHRWRKLDTASSRVRISEMKTSLSTTRSKTTFLKIRKKQHINFFGIKMFLIIWICINLPRQIHIPNTKDPESNNLQIYYTSQCFGSSLVSIRTGYSILDQRYNPNPESKIKAAPDPEHCFFNRSQIRIHQFKISGSGSRIPSLYCCSKFLFLFFKR